MARIAFIAPNVNMFELGQRIISDLQLPHAIEFYHGSLADGVAIAHRVEAEGVDAIISRGGTAELIIKSGLRTPVIEVPITGPDLAQALYEARAITGLDNAVIGVLAFKNMTYDIELFSKLMGVNLKVYKLATAEDIPTCVDQAEADKVDVVVGGLFTTQLAAARGIRTLLLGSGEASFRAAFLEADKVASARALEKEKTQQFEVLVDYSIDGIISVDRDSKIRVFNPSAQKILGRTATEVIGTDVGGVLAGPQVADCLQTGREYIGEIIRTGSIDILLNIAPINVSGEITGAVITFQNISRIVEMEEKIRKELYTKGLVAQYDFSQLLGVSPEITEAKRIAQEFAVIDATVLITGPSGTGKELFAQSIHNHSQRKNGPFVAINCAALPPSLLESELFGYVEGAFTGATRKGKPGLFELAHRGTIFLDEISEMDKYGQSRLLRVLQERQVRRLGDDKYIPIDVRIIAASNKNLPQLVREGSLREDLYFRLNVLTLNLPALKDRQGDVRYLANHFLDQYASRFGRELTIDEEAAALFEQYPWPGNVRELRNFIERLVILLRSRYVTADAVRALFQNREFAIRQQEVAGSGSEPADEKARLVSVLRSTGYNQSKAAVLLGIDRSTLYRKLKRYNLTVKNI